MTGHGLRIDFYRDPAGLNRWRMWSGSRIVAQASQGYARRPAMVRNLETVLGGTYSPYGLTGNTPRWTYIRWTYIPVRETELMGSGTTASPGRESLTDAQAEVLAQFEAAPDGRWDGPGDFPEFDPDGESYHRDEQADRRADAADSAQHDTDHQGVRA